MIKLNIQRFSSTNKTTHYELSQYVSSDLPTYLVDYNSDMSKIDAGINTAQTTADTASTAATNAATAASTAQTTANTAITNAATADGKAVTANNNIGTLANLTTAEKTTLVGAINEVDGDVGNLSALTTDVSTSIVAAINSIETKIEELDNYSTSESDTGKLWINGKHIYRKCFTYTKGQLGSSNPNLAHGITGLDTLIGCFGLVKRTDGYEDIVPNGNPNTDFGLFFSDFDSQYIRPRIGYGVYSVLDSLTIILEYTKSN